MKKIIVMCLLFISIIIFSKEQVPPVYDKYMRSGEDLEILFESPNDGMSSKMILYFSGNLFVYFRQDLFNNISEKLTTVPKEIITIITRKIKYFGSDRGISGNYKELYEKVIEIFSDKLPSVIHYIRKPDFELIN